MRNDKNVNKRRKKRLIATTIAFACILANTVISFAQEDIFKKPKEILAEVLMDMQESEEKSVLEGKIIVVDAGHGKGVGGGSEAIAPGEKQTKPAFVSGTSGKSQSEAALNLAVSLKLEKSLTDLGATVHMTRTGAEAPLSNIGRAELGNTVNADIAVRIHADGSTNKSVKGMSMLLPGNKYIKNQALIDNSALAGKKIFTNVLEQTGANDRGYSVRDDMVGFNWSKVPCVLLEMGFMTNDAEDKLLAQEEYQQRIVKGITDGLIEYFEEIEKAEE